MDVFVIEAEDGGFVELTRKDVLQAEADEHDTSKARPTPPR
jgi:hypothetical protein